MKKNLLSLFCLCLSLSVLAQKLSKLPESKLSAIETESHIRFLASDELMGRKTGEAGNLVASRYIAEQFRLLGLKSAVANGSYLQPVPFKNMKPLTEGLIQIGDSSLKIMDDFIAYAGKGANIQNAPVVFANFGWQDDKGLDDYKDLDVKGKVVVIQLGTPTTQKPFEAIQASELKTLWAEQKGALAVVEIFTAQIPWRNLVRFYNSERLVLDSKSDKAATPVIPHLWVSSSRAALMTKDKLATISLKIGDKPETPVASYNVAGILEGTDPKLKSEYIVLSAHFDHIGVNKNSKPDSIANGARDNAMGVAAVLTAAKAFSQMRPKRSILFIGYTGEELGLLGSRHYVAQPLVPLKQCVFNLNCDGAGYNDTTLLTTVGLSRTDAKTELEIAAKAFGLKVIDDQMPEQNLFDRSDNVNFAAKGVPAPNFAPGIVKFDEVITKYYHQPADNPESLSFSYVHKYCQAYAYAARLIANRAAAPKWIAGDKYEKAWQELFGH
jgi:hypothetical protein